MKQAKIMVLCLLSLLLIVGCSADSKPAGTPEELKTILDGLTQSGKVDAAKYGIQLAQWLQATELSKEEIASVGKEWLQEVSPEIRAKAQETLTKLQEEVGDLFSEGSDKLKQGLADGTLQKKLQEVLNHILSSGGIEK